MSLEIEKNFYHYDEKKLKNELKNMNLKYKINLLKTHKVKHNGLTIRVRDEGFRKTFTIKNKKTNNEYNKEYQVNVSNIKETITMLKLLGIKNFTYQEKIRETYFYNQSEICFDYVPGQENFLQIESKTQEELYELCDKFKLNKNDQKIDMNQHFGLNRDEIKDKIQFKYLNEIKNKVKKNKSNFEDFIRKQILMYNKFILKKKYKIKNSI